MKVIIDIDFDIMQKITNQYYGENEVDKTLINELLMSLMHGISLNKIRAEIEDCITYSRYFTTTKACCGVRDDVLRVIDKYRGGDNV